MADFEERADQLPLNVIEATLADGPIFREARRKLLAKGAKLLIGPRGTGKTHLMRYTYINAIKNEKAPLPIYANFSRYLNLEPLLQKSPDALKKFHSWVVAKIIISCFDLLADSGRDASILSDSHEFFAKDKLNSLIALLERGSGDEEYDAFGKNLTINHAIAAIDFLCKHENRARAVVFLDDAALSLTQPYLVAFFEIFRLLKTETISPKASVYPGSTQYGPTFHASHEAEEVELWLSVEDPQYSSIMGDIGLKRIEGIDQVNADTLEFLKFVAFGIPRAYLRLIREFIDSSGSNLQQKINRVVERQTQLIGAEYDSLKIKLKQFGSIIETGRMVFDRSVNLVRENQTSDEVKNIVLGIKKDIDQNPLSERMFRFLIEIGMIYPLPSVSHGVNRKYDRFIPHFAFLYQTGVFRRGKGSSPRDIATYMTRSTAKQPIRRELATILNSQELSQLKLDLPPCQVCGAGRMNDSQRYCHACGKELLGSSLFEECMRVPLDGVPGISKALARRILDDTSIRTIGHVYAAQNPSQNLQKANYVGPVRASEIINKVTVVVNEFLS